MSTLELLPVDFTLRRGAVQKGRQRKVARSPGVIRRRLWWTIGSNRSKPDSAEKVEQSQREVTSVEYHYSTFLPVMTGNSRTRCPGSAGNSEAACTDFASDPFPVPVVLPPRRRSRPQVRTPAGDGLHCCRPCTRPQERHHLSPGCRIALGSTCYRFTGSQRLREIAEDQEPTSEDHPDLRFLGW